MKRADVIALIEKERDYQDGKWGGPEHDGKHHPFDWIVFIQKYLGKAAAGVMRAANHPELIRRKAWKQHVREMFVKVAALCVAVLENCPQLQDEPEETN